MFGSVPKIIWERRHPPDERNRILIGLNCLLIKSPEFTALIDTGMGEKWDAKMTEIFGIDRTPGLVGELARCGVQPEEVTHVLFSHLHIDHAGGNTRFGASEGQFDIVFPNARHVVQRLEWQDAHRDHPATCGDYTLDDLDPIARAGLLDFIDGDGEVLPGIRAHVTGGHTRGHQIFFIESNGTALVYLADLMPTTSHLKPHYHMAYDLFPMQIAEERIRMVEEILARDLMCVFEHDAHVPLAKLHRGDGDKLHATSVAN